jgi:glycosyltransferase 2 family protein
MTLFSRRLKKLLPIVISIGLTILIGYILYSDVPDWRKSLKIMLHGSPLWILSGLIFSFLHIVFRAVRWGTLLSTAKPKIQFKNLFSLTLIKYVINIIPPRSGEFAASILLARKEKLSSTTVIAASVFERILDLFSVLIIFGFYLMGSAADAGKGAEILSSIRIYAIKGIFLLGAGLIVLLILLRNAHWAARIPARIRAPFLSFLEGFRVLQSHGVMFRVLLLSLAVWFCILGQIWLFVRSYLPAFPLAGAALLVVMTAVGVAIPTPAGVGGYQYFMSLALITFFRAHLSPGDPHTEAAGISNASYLLSMVPIFIAGLACLNREGLSLTQISQMKESVQGADVLPKAV